MSFDTPIPPYNASDPHATFLNASCIDFLLIELVPMAHRLAQEFISGKGREKPGSAGEGRPTARGSEERGRPAEMGAGLGAVTSNGSGGAAGPGSNAGTAGAATAEGKLDDEEERDAVFYRLEMLGYRVGQGLVERFSRDRPRFTDTLDMIKFLCKDLWTLVFRKQIDNLKTNHRGVYVLTDNDFRPLGRMSTEAGAQAIPKAQPDTILMQSVQFLWFPCGVVRGALASMGINATVQAETTDLRGATFQIKTVGAKP
ncbi:MAG: SUMO ligase siz1 [Chaenotheca gracillima]|nr:MAG: SUMO ligase siz1 [Chaenotheca gracillima]